MNEETLKQVSEWFKSLGDTNRSLFLNTLQIEPSTIKGYALYHTPTGLYYRPRGHKNMDLDVSPKIYSKIPHKRWNIYVYFTGKEKDKDKIVSREIIKEKIIKSSNPIKSIQNTFEIPQSDWKIVTIY